MKTMQKIIRFLGSVNFAILLLSLAMMGVIYGTFAESYADSHDYAAHVVYQHPFFNALLVLFFVNILVSALLRYPFKKKHLPFLLTHLGLLMVIGGTMYKNLKGLQGHLFVLEGSGNHSLLLASTPSIQIFPRHEQDPISIPLAQLKKGWTRVENYPHVRFRLASYTPHVVEKYETWIKDQEAYIMGFPKIPVYKWQESSQLPLFMNLNLELDNQTPWQVVAVQTEDPISALKTLYLHQLQLQLYSLENLNEKTQINLSEALKTPLVFAKGLLTTTLDFEKDLLKFEWQDLHSPYCEIKTFHLNKPIKFSHVLQENKLLNSVFQIELARPSSILAMIEEPDEDLIVCAFDQEGHLFKESFSSNNLKSLIVYDQGFGGYAVQTRIPLTFSKKQMNDQLYETLSPLLNQTTSLIPPLEILKRACKKAKIDFTQTVIDFFQEWQKSQTLLINSNSLFAKNMSPYFDFQRVPLADQKTCQWIHCLFEKLSASLRQGEDFLSLLKKQNWPLLVQLQTSIQQEKDSTELAILARQIFSLEHYLPTIEQFIEPSSLLSAYFYLYGIDANFLNHLPNVYSNEFLTLETPLTHRLFPLPPPLKVEEQKAGIILEAEMDKWVQKIPLGYASAGQALNWPMFNGAFQIRFQPQIKPLPYHVRLQQARQFNYPNSPQTFSYEADISVKNLKNSTYDFFTLSMNHVYETWDGYRFYLSSVQGGDNTVKRIQLAVNYDPAKYLLTYPGAICLFFGILLLFWMRPYRQT